MFFRAVIYLLALVGALVVLAVIAFAIAYAVMMRRLVSKMRDTVQEMEGMLSRTIDAEGVRELQPYERSSPVPPMRIHLEEYSSGASLCALGEQIDQWLREHSFEPAGAFVIEEQDFEKLWTYVSEDRQLVAAIRYPAEAHEPYVEFCFDLGEQLRGGVSNPSDATVQPQPDAAGRFFQGALSDDFQLLSRMWLEAKELVDRHEVNNVDPSTVCQFYEEAHAAEMDCRIREGGISESEIRVAFQSQGVEPNREDIEAIQEQWQDAIESHLLDFSSRGQDHHYSGRQVLVVHNGSLHAYLVGRIQDLVEEFGDLEGIDRDELLELCAELRILLEKFSPREAMARFRPLLPKLVRYDLIDQLRFPIEADLYLLPQPVTDP